MEDSLVKPPPSNHLMIGETATLKISQTEQGTFNFVPKLRAGDGMNSSRIQQKSIMFMKVSDNIRNPGKACF